MSQPTTDSPPPASIEREAPADPRLTAAALGVVTALVFYVGLHALSRPAIIYLPVERSWVWSTSEGAIAMGLYGHIVNACIGFALGWAVGRFTPVASWLTRTTTRRRALRRAVLWSLILAIGYIVGVEALDWIITPGPTGTHPT